MVVGPVLFLFGHALLIVSGDGDDGGGKCCYIMNACARACII